MLRSLSFLSKRRDEKNLLPYAEPLLGFRSRSEEGEEHTEMEHIRGLLEKSNESSDHLFGPA